MQQSVPSAPARVLLHVHFVLSFPLHYLHTILFHFSLFLPHFVTFLSSIICLFQILTFLDFIFLSLFHFVPLASVPFITLLASFFSFVSIFNRSSLHVFSIFFILLYLLVLSSFMCSAFKFYPYLLSSLPSFSITFFHSSFPNFFLLTLLLFFFCFFQ